MISSSQRQHSQQTNIHAPVGIRTHDLRRRAAVDLRLRQRGYLDRRPMYLELMFFADTLRHTRDTSLLCTCLFHHLSSLPPYQHFRTLELDCKLSLCTPYAGVMWRYVIDSTSQPQYPHGRSRRCTMYGRLRGIPQADWESRRKEKSLALSGMGP